MQEQQMRQRIFKLAGGRRRRRVLLATLASAVALGAFLISSALAVHDLSFQLDGDVSASTTTNVGGNTQMVDWNSLFDVSANGIVTQKDPLPTGFTATSFDKDFTLKATGSFNPADNDIFTTGSKDELAISGWQCKSSNNVTDKNDIMNAYSTAFTASNGDRILYFGLEKNDNTGTNDVGFWFLQDENVNCDGSQGTATFSGAHADGDLLIVSEFSQGGVVSTIKVYRWNGGANGSLNVANPIAEGVDCENTNAGDEACATVNRPPDGTTGNGTITTPWPTADKTDGPGNTLRTGEFFEGGVNLTANNLAGKCFNTFLADTRASTSTTSDLEDFSRGNLGGCQSKTTTTPSITSEQIPAHGTLSVTDSAKVDVTGVSSFKGSVTFFLCRSSELDSNGECSTGGTQIGSAKTVTSPGETVVSDAAGLTAVDNYCWRAEFSGDDAVGVPPSSDHATSECFTVTPRQPTITTDATDGPVDFGSPISDTISLTGTADTPGTDGIGPGGTINATNRQPADGTISVTAFGPDNCTTVAHTATITVSGDNTAYGGPGSSTQFTPTAPGVYTYVASYSGDSPNTLGVGNTACPDPTGAEAVTVRQIPTAVETKQRWFPNDTATITAAAGNLAAGGTVEFSLYTNATCSGTAVFSQTRTLNGGNPTEEVSTNNTSYEITTGYNDAADSNVGRHSWKVVYTPAAGDTAHTGSQSSCDAEHFNITYTNDPGPTP
jgi:hypothetical protein